MWKNLTGQFINWWKKDERYITLIQSLLLAMLPLVCCIVSCALEGRTIGEVYLPESPWNDELFYYKQVEGIVNFGYPQGYFGFNESHALKLSFAAWSPVLVFPWVLWGLLFGWNLMSPILANIVFMMLCCFLFVWLVRPSWKQEGAIALLFCFFRLFVRYMLSGMPENICFALLILFYGLAVNYKKREKTWKLVLLFAMSCIMTLMRPYFILFLFLPVYFWIRRDKWKGLAGSVLIFLATAFFYAGIKHYLGAEYFDPLFFTDWISAFFERGLFGGLYYTLNKLRQMGTSFLQYALEGVRSGFAAGAFIDGYLVVMTVLLVQGLVDCWKRYREKKENHFLAIELHLLFCFVAMVVALLLMYKLEEGSKHLLTFIAAGIFVLPVIGKRPYGKVLFLGAAFLFLYFIKANTPYDYQVPYRTAERQEQVEDWSAGFAGTMELNRDDVPNFENVVIWVFQDKDSSEDTYIRPLWQALYGLPKGFGISCCMPEYVTGELERLQSRYLFTPPGGQIDEMCKKANYEELYRNVDGVLYELRSGYEEE